MLSGVKRLRLDVWLEPAACPLIIVAWLWVFFWGGGKESTLPVLRVGGETVWGELNAGKPGLLLFEFHGRYWYLSQSLSVLMGVSRAHSFGQASKLRLPR